MKLVATARFVCIGVVLSLLPIVAAAEDGPGTHSEVVHDEDGFRLMVDGSPFEVKGMVWSYTPIGENHTYDLWSEPEEIIRETIDRDAEMMKEIGVNAIRVFDEVPPEWITYFYREHGIYTIVNPLFGRYGVDARGIWYPLTDYSDVHSREAILDEALSAVERYKDVPGVLMFMFGNENNYGLEWESHLIQDLPEGQRNEARASYLYDLFEEAISEAKEINPNHAYGIVNGDIQYLDLIEELVPSLDVLGVNVYRGLESGDAFYQSVERLGVPVVYTEFGADAYNALTQQEDQYHQAKYLYHQWREIYLQGYGKGRSQNAIGGFVFQWMDEWWKYDQETYESFYEHNTEGSWSNAAYEHDAASGVDNMHEEWFGVVALSPRTYNGVHRRVPRAAYHLLGELWELPLYDSSEQEVVEHFDGVEAGLHLTRGESAGLREENQFEPISLEGFSLAIDGSVAIDDDDIDGDDWREAAEGRTGQEMGVNLGFEPTEGLSGAAELRVWNDPILPGFPQDDAVPAYYDYDDGEVGRNAALYSAEFDYTTDAFDLEGYYRTGRPDWYLHGDPFYLMPEAWDREAMDIAGSDAPFGLELRPHGALDGLRVAVGPELYWGAEPSVAWNYYREMPIGELDTAVGLTHVEQFLETEDAEPDRSPGRKASISGEAELSPYFFGELAVLHSGQGKVGDTYYHPGTGQEEEIEPLDTFALMGTVGTDVFRYTHLYTRFRHAGLVASGEPMVPRAGFQKADSGAGNRRQLDIGTRVIVGDVTGEAEVRWRQPLVGPIQAAGQERNRLDDPFAVFWNRETLESEMVLTYDQEGATYFHDWNNPDRERSTVAGSLSLLHTYYAGPTDAGAFKSAEDIWYPFDQGLPEQYHLWSATARLLVNPMPGLRINMEGRAGRDQSLGDDGDRLVEYFGGDLAVRYRRLMLETSLDVNAWGPETWHREFNLTYPMQWSVDLGYGFDTPSFIEREGRVGVRTIGRTYGEHSADPEPDDGFSTITTVYLNIGY